MMRPMSCLWQRSRLEGHVDGALGSRAARAVQTHLERCAACRVEVESLQRLRHLLRSAATPADPDWSGLWTAVERRIRNEAPRPLRDSWWRPLWKPVWGHPRLASAAAGLALVLLTVPFWTGTEEFGPSADAPVTVQDAATDSKGSVMVYSNRDPSMTVVWVLANDSAGGDD